MNQRDSTKDYYKVLGADENAPRSEIERLYKRLAVEHHPDRGGDEEEMKSLNEAYGVLRDEVARRAYDAQRFKPTEVESVPPFSSPPAQADAITGQAAGALLCVAAGLVLLFLVRFQWIWFLWPLAILGAFMILAGVLIAHATLVALREALPRKSPVRRFHLAQEILFWSLVCGGMYGIYLVFSVAGER